MDNQSKQRWVELAESASKENDLEKLLAALEELNRALEERKQQLEAHQSQHLIKFSGQTS